MTIIDIMSESPSEVDAASAEVAGLSLGAGAVSHSNTSSGGPGTPTAGPTQPVGTDKEPWPNHADHYEVTSNCSISSVGNAKAGLEIRPKEIITIR